MTKSKDQIINTIKRLREMRVDRGCTPSEAAAAAHHLQRLLTEHNLSMFDVERQTFDEEVGKEGVHLGGKRIPTWAGGFSTAVGGPLGCKIIFDRTEHGWRVLFIGFRSDAAVASYLFDTLSRDLLASATEQARREGYGGAQIVQYRNSYLQGAAAAIRTRLDAENRAADQAPTPAPTPDYKPVATAGALVVMTQVKAQAVEVYYKKEFPSVVNNAPSKARFNSGAYSSGHARGKVIPLRRGVEGQEQQRLR